MAAVTCYPGVGYAGEQESSNYTPPNQSNNHIDALKSVINGRGERI